MIGSNIDFGIKPSSVELNCINIQSINNFINKTKNISCIINLVALNLNESEKNMNNTIKINIDGNINLLNIAKKLNIPYIYISTGAVFSSDDMNIIFFENSITNPNSIYGYTKDVSEKISLLYDKAIIIRTGWLFGSLDKKNYKFVENTINKLIFNNEILAINNFNGSPTYVIDFIEKIKFIITNSIYGIHHVVNDGYGSGYDIASYIAKILKINNNYIKSIRSTEITTSYSNRSKSEILKSNFEYNKLRHWTNALEKFIYIFLNINNLKYINNNIIVNKKLWDNRNKCRLCDSYNLLIFFNLNSTPLANKFVKEIIYQEKIPLDICICDNCKHIQLLQIIDANIQYKDYIYISSTSQTMIKHLQYNVLKFVTELNIQYNDNILEIGANDGVCIKHLLDNKYKNIIGVDPADNINNMHNLPIILSFFGSHLIEYLNNIYGKFKLIYAFHCCAHIENIKDVFYTIENILNDTGVFIMEVGYFYEVYKNKLFDTIYHEHIDYHTCTVLNKFGKLYNLTLYKINENNIQGGSIQFYFSKNKNIEIDISVLNAYEKEKNIKLFDYNNLLLWKDNILKIGYDINIILKSFKNNNKKIIGYGAPAKLTTFMYQYEIDKNLISYIIEDNIYKQNLYTPGNHIPIKSFDYMNNDNIDYIIIFSWNFADEIIYKLSHLRTKGVRIIIPFPEIKII